MQQELVEAVHRPNLILVVDDEYLIRWALRRSLEAVGYLVAEAPTITAARLLMLAGGVDLVLLDLLLPDGNGLDLLAEFMARPVPPPIVLLSASATPEVVARAIAGGAFAFIHKPFVLGNIASVVARALPKVS